MDNHTEIILGIILAGIVGWVYFRAWFTPRNIEDPAKRKSERIERMLVNPVTVILGLVFWKVVILLMVAAGLLFCVYLFFTWTLNWADGERFGESPSIGPVQKHHCEKCGITYMDTCPRCGGKPDVGTVHADRVKAKFGDTASPESTVELARFIHCGFVFEARRGVVERLEEEGFFVAVVEDALDRYDKGESLDSICDNDYLINGPILNALRRRREGEVVDSTATEIPQAQLNPPTTTAKKDPKWEYTSTFWGTMRRGQEKGLL